MTERQRQVLGDLRHFTDHAIKYDLRRKWARPLDVGGRNGSHHGTTLMQLHKMGYAELQRWLIGIRHTNYYKISEAGRRALKETR